MDKRIVPCKYYFKEGYCVKGKYCVFSHDSDDVSISGPCLENSGKGKKSNIVCKFFQREGRCRYGSSCTFLHESKQTTQTATTSSSASSTSADKSSIPQQCTNPNSDLPDIDSLWGFQSNDPYSNRDGEYFYGACTNVNVSNENKPKFTDLFTSTDKKLNTKEMEPRKMYTKKICTFFVAGNCRYGSACRDIHSIAPSSQDEAESTDNSIMLNCDRTSLANTSDELLQKEIDDAKNAECGICLDKIGMYDVMYCALIALFVITKV